MQTVYHLNKKLKPTSIAKWLIYLRYCLRGRWEKRGWVYVQIDEIVYNLHKYSLFYTVFKDKSRGMGLWFDLNNNC